MDKKLKFSINLIFWSCILLMAMCIFMGILCGHRADTLESFKKEAVERGYAEFTGEEMAFKWLTERSGGE